MKLEEVYEFNEDLFESMRALLSLLAFRLLNNPYEILDNSNFSPGLSHVRVECFKFI